MNKTTTLITLTIAATLTHHTHTQANNQPQPLPTVQAIRTIAQNHPLAELPAQAAQIIANTQQQHRERTAIRTIRILLQDHNALAPALVSAIAKAAPDTAAAAASEAIQLYPHNAYTITKAAVAAAPQRAAQIALRAAHTNPEQTKQIAGGTYQGAPQKTNQLNTLFTTLSTATAQTYETTNLGIRTVRIRIGSSSSNTPADLTNLALNRPGERNPQLVFPGITQEILPDGTVQYILNLGNVETPTNLATDTRAGFDIISRQLNQNSEFTKDPIIQIYVQ